MFEKVPAWSPINTLIVSFVCGVLFCLPAIAAAQERVVSYQTTASIQPDSSVQLTERIAYDFDSNLKRGIYRDIDTVKKLDGKSYRLEISDVLVVDDTGNPYAVEILDRREDVRLNIGGDTPRWTGVTVFEISYTIDGILVFNEDNDALLLDAVGFDWGVPIVESGATVLLPATVDENELVYECFVGQPGSTNPCDDVQVGAHTVATGSTASQVNQLTFAHNSNLGNGAGMTIGVTFPKGLVTETQPIEIKPIPDVFIAWLILSLLPLVLAVPHFYRKAKTKLQLPIVRQYDAPADVALYEAGLILKHTYSTKHLAAQIISLAQRGYLKIVHYQKEKFFFFKESGYLYVQLRPGTDLPEFERTLLEELTAAKFTITNTAALEAISVDHTIPDEIANNIKSAVAVTQVKKLQNKFAKPFERLSKLARTNSVQNGVFVEDFTVARLSAVFSLFRYLLLSAGSLVLLYTVLKLFYSERSFETITLVTVGTCIVSAALIAIIGLLIYQLPNLSQKGVAAKEHLLGLEQYMEVAEKERMDFHFDPEKNPELFEKLLPYAVLLGMQKRWIKHLDKLDHQPNWYHSSSGQQFSATSLNSVVSSMNSSTSSSSPGAGSAGGGFGGGGGGSR